MFADLFKIVINTNTVLREREGAAEAALVRGARGTGRGPGPMAPALGMHAKKGM
jgi:hypothetical protein